MSRYFTSALYTLLIVIGGVLWLNSEISRGFREDLKQTISQELVVSIPPDPGEKIDAMYLLGGNQRSMEYKFQKASEFYHKGICKKIIGLSRSGKTSYSPELNRNMTKNEWFFMQLKRLNIPEENIELIEVDEGFFGTYSEAVDISSFVKKKQYRSLLLIAQPYHTKRVISSFSEFPANRHVALYVQDSGEKMYLDQLIVEYAKLKVYQYFLLTNKSKG